MKRLLALLLSVISSAALAQTTATVNPNPVPVQPSATDDVPPGGCMPIGMTASGDIVFPIQCKAFIERHRGAPVELKPATLEDKPAAKQSEGKELEGKHSEDKPSEGKHSEELAPEIGKPADRPVERAVLEEKATARQSEVMTPETMPPQGKQSEGTQSEGKPLEGSAPESSKPADKPVGTAPSEQKSAARQSEGSQSEGLPSEDKHLEDKHLEAKHLDGKHLEEPAPETGKPATKPAEAVSSPKRAELTGRERANNLGNCTHYRTYNAASGTYRSYDGRVRPCR